MYLDHAATTPLRPEVRAAMAPYLDERFGNPASSHAWGRSARVALEEAREKLATALGARRDEIVFTGSGTEADNLAVFGRLRAVRAEDASAGDATAVACSAVEHSAVLRSVEAVAREGGLPVLIGVDANGRVLLDATGEALRSRPALVSVMWGNNEIGTLQPVAEIAALCSDAGVAFHSDAVQAFGKVRVRMDETPCDLLSVSAHKIGGPRGVGALFVRRGTALAPLLHGGGQEGGVRSGTVNVAGAVGFAEAADLAVREMDARAAAYRQMRETLERSVLESVPDARVIAQGADRLPHVLSLHVGNVDRDALLMSLDLENVAVSAGSACRSGSTAPSHVLAAIGLVDAAADDAGDAPGSAAIRFSFGWTTTLEEVTRAAAVFARVVERVRALAAA